MGTGANRLEYLSCVLPSGLIAVKFEYQTLLIPPVLRINIMNTARVGLRGSLFLGRRFMEPKDPMP